MFSERSARAEARRYRRRGLDATSRRIVDLLTRQGVEGRTLLEVGGGIGDIEIELLKAGVTRAVNVELTPTYEEVAGILLREAGFEDRVERRLMDFAEAAVDVEPADIVVLNRVICCYPDMPRLAAAAAGRAQGVLVMSFPNGRWWTRLGVLLMNLALRMVRWRFQVFTHPPERILAVVEQHGLRATVNRRGIIWQVAALERTPSRSDPRGSLPREVG